MACLPVFPAEYSIPPAYFYNIQGLSQWLNQNNTYKKYFMTTYPYLYGITSSLSSLNYTVDNVPLGPSVTTLSQYQALMYKQQIQLFAKVYAHNSNAYVNYKCNSISPVYYTFKTYKEKSEYDSSVGLVNKLYPFKAMAEGPLWQIPFPL